MIIGIFGRRNVGKSSLANVMLGQEFSIVSNQPGTTADPSKKRIELKGLGACTIVDTAGIDDIGELGEKRVLKSMQAIKEVDIALLVFAGKEFTSFERELATAFKKYETPFLIVHNQSDILELPKCVLNELQHEYNVPVIEFSCNLINEDKQKTETEILISKLASVKQSAEKTILHGLVSKGDNIVLVCPIDSSAPAKRLILPQVMAIRDILDNNAVAHVVTPDQLHECLSAFTPDKTPVKLVVTDSQAFKEVDGIMQNGGWSNIPLTSFSILLARSKGPFKEYMKGIESIKMLKDGDKILILESCSHRATCEDIGRVKIPMMLKKFTLKNLEFTFVPSLNPLPLNLKEYAMAIQCGGCMVTHKQLNNRIKDVVEAGVPITNYGMAIGFVNSIRIDSIVL